MLPPLAQVGPPAQVKITVWSRRATPEPSVTCAVRILLRFAPSDVGDPANETICNPGVAVLVIMTASEELKVPSLTLARIVSCTVVPDEPEPALYEVENRPLASVGPLTGDKDDEMALVGPGTKSKETVLPMTGASRPSVTVAVIMLFCSDAREYCVAVSFILYPSADVFSAVLVMIIALTEVVSQPWQVVQPTPFTDA